MTAHTCAVPTHVDRDWPSRLVELLAQCYLMDQEVGVAVAECIAGF